MSRAVLTVGLLLAALTLPVVGAAQSNAREDDRQRILAILGNDIPETRLSEATVFLSGDLAAVRVLFRLSACCGVRSVCIVRSIRPSMAFIGVRISWLMFARNSLLAWVAASAT